MTSLTKITGKPIRIIIHKIKTKNLKELFLTLVYQTKPCTVEFSATNVHQLQISGNTCLKVILFLKIKMN